MSDLIKRTNRSDDPNQDVRLLDGEVQLQCVEATIAVLQVPPGSFAYAWDDVRCRIRTQDWDSRTTEAFLSEEQLDNLIDMLIGVRGAIRGTPSPEPIRRVQYADGSSALVGSTTPSYPPPENFSPYSKE